MQWRCLNKNLVVVPRGTLFTRTGQEQTERERRFQIEIIFSVFTSHVIKTKNRNNAMNKVENLGYER